MATKSDKRNIYVRMRDGRDVKLYGVPATAKITYGPMVPNGRHNGPQDFMLRVYESENKQIACFSDVVEFRDMDLKMERRYFKGDFTEEVTDSTGKKVTKTKDEVQAVWKDVTNGEEPDVQSIVRTMKNRNNYPY